MNKVLLHSYLDSLWDDYRTSHCRFCQRETEYWETAKEIKEDNEEFTRYLTARLTLIECLLHPYQLTNNDVATAIEGLTTIRRELNE